VPGSVGDSPESRPVLPLLEAGVLQPESVGEDGNSDPEEMLPIEIEIPAVIPDLFPVVPLVALPLVAVPFLPSLSASSFRSLSGTTAKPASK
jgi:hypothetical protein